MTLILLAHLNLQQFTDSTDFSAWQSHYPEQFGLSLEEFERTRKNLLAEPSGSKREIVVFKIIESIIAYQEKVLLRLAQKEAQRRGGYLIYRNFDKKYGLTPEPYRLSGGGCRTPASERVLMRDLGSERFTSKSASSSSPSSASAGVSVLSSAAINRGERYSGIDFKARSATSLAHFRIPNTNLWILLKGKLAKKTKAETEKNKELADKTHTEIVQIISCLMFNLGDIIFAGLSVQEALNIIIAYEGFITTTPKFRTLKMALSIEAKLPSSSSSSSASHVVSLPPPVLPNTDTSTSALRSSSSSSAGTFNSSTSAIMGSAQSGTKDINNIKKRTLAGEKEGEESEKKPRF